ncbi:TPA: penicillin-binding protein, partial [Streptococcus equi subsp. zooepidemicus]|nr:penicillin-binding protein [Streptococcus equi subsp. zooepidemicus]
MTFLELLQKKFFPKKYQEKQALKARAAQDMTSKEAANQTDDPALISQQVQAEGQSVLQRSKSYGAKRKKQPVWLQRLEAILPSSQNPIRRFLRRYHIG